MMTDVTLVFPHQLFADHPSIKKHRPIYLIEEWLFFRQYRFHRQKLLLHRASMKRYANALVQRDFTVAYIDCTDALSDVRKFIDHLAQQNVTRIYIANVADDWLRRRLESGCTKHRIRIAESVSPNFLNALDQVKPFFDGKTTYFQTAFYIHQRKQRALLLDPKRLPLGGKWTFDAENRLKYPKNALPPRVTPAKEDRYIREAKAYVDLHFSNNPGNMECFIYPTGHAEASLWLDEFFEKRFEKFGSYEDAIVSEEHYLHHAVISPMLNIGLLAPSKILEKTLAAAAEKNIPLNSLEGFIRQIIGWREFIRIVYEREGGKQRTKNYWRFTRKIPDSFWEGKTGVFPVDQVIKKVLLTGYSHHIERLMVVGNFMLLCEFAPDEVYRWFMEMYVDAYDWVMVP
ncbi:MAG TPA: cryptochrome/photolyase family protein, partial [Methylomicrobium sp.]|nr:cryptochrome/photolyase family protein [Methylomicrobium sp.]